jgi:hypothetical protein
MLGPIENEPTTCILDGIRGHNSIFRFLMTVL